MRISNDDSQEITSHLGENLPVGLGLGLRLGFELSCHPLTGMIEIQVSLCVKVILYSQPLGAGQSRQGALLGLMTVMTKSPDNQWNKALASEESAP